MNPPLRPTDEVQRPEGALREREEQLRLFAEHSPAAVAMFDRDMNYLVVSRRWMEAYQLGNKSVIGHNHYEIFPKLHQQWIEVHRRCLAGAVEKCVEEFNLRADGQTERIRWEVRPWHRADGSIGGIIFSEDIAERRQAENRIRHLNRVYDVLSDINQTIVRDRDPQKLFDAACRIAVEKGGFCMAWIGLLDGQTNRVNVAAKAGSTGAYLEKLNISLNDEPRGHGPTAEAIRTREHAVCNDVEHDPRMAPWQEDALRLGLRATAAFPLMVEGKSIGTFSLYAGTADFFNAEELRLLDELVADISFALEIHGRETKRRQAEQALRESDERFRQLAENVHEVFWMTDPTGMQMHYVSPAYEKIWGRTCASLCEAPRTWMDAVHPDDRARILNAAATKPRRGTYDETYRILRPDGTERWIHDRAFPVRDANDEILRIVGTAEDITERRQLEEQFRQSQKMEAIGQLAGGVAHDFNNILAAIMMQAELTAAICENLPAEAREGLLEIRVFAERAANLTRQLLAFSRRQIMQLTVLDVNEIAASLTKMLQRILGADIRLQFNPHPHPLMTKADAGMLDQVLLNLVVNARDAMPDGGELVIEITEKTFTEAEAVLLADAMPGHYICLRVTDTGMGIPPENLSRIFEPFFTTKAKGKGTGLGLATAFGIVRQHGGFFRVDSKVGKGTTFQIYLRAEKISAKPGAEEAAKYKSRGGTETILLVEDESSVRILTHVVLERAGYQVLEAPDGVAAQRIWEQHQDSINLLLTDIVMPEGVNGRELAARLLARNPKLRVIFTSGYSAEIAGRELTLQQGQNFIQKPSSPWELLEIVRKCLDGEQPPKVK